MSEEKLIFFWSKLLVLQNMITTISFRILGKVLLRIEFPNHKVAFNSVFLRIILLKSMVIGLFYKNKIVYQIQKHQHVQNMSFWSRL